MLSEQIVSQSEQVTRTMWGRVMWEDCERKVSKRKRPMHRTNSRRGKMNEKGWRSIVCSQARGNICSPATSGASRRRGVIFRKLSTFIGQIHHWAVFCGWEEEGEEEQEQRLVSSCLWGWEMDKGWPATYTSVLYVTHVHTDTSKKSSQVDLCTSRWEVKECKVEMNKCTSVGLD